MPHSVTIRTKKLVGLIIDGVSVQPKYEKCNLGTMTTLVRHAIMALAEWAAKEAGLRIIVPSDKMVFIEDVHMILAHCCADLMRDEIRQTQSKA